ncbi:hypothetical protein F4778DRAFT_511039 [Xylariomycetidae sp. FL2044]|nr:hypothetical protein F4778DRAFT_511039 [Xylariomycetidae sp. FL2044]
MVAEMEFPAAFQDKLSRFSRFLASKKNQIELFGKDLPLCRASLVQVTEANTHPAPYICIQGLRHTADITRIHSVMSHKRYRALYDPLKLCYEVSDLKHVASTEPEASKSGHPLVRRPDLGALGSTPGPSEVFELSQLPGFDEPMPEVFYQYTPMENNRTYCGALFQTSVNGRPCVSTIGGLLNVSGQLYVTTCEHGSPGSSTETVPSIADTLVVTDLPSDVEGPLVFAFDGPPDGLHDGNAPEDVRVGNQSLLGERTFDAAWEDLDVASAVKTYGEWGLVPIGDHAALPNLVERWNTEKGKDTGAPKIYFLEEFSSPRPGHPAYIASHSKMGSTGTVSANTSFMFGGGIGGATEIWTVLLDKREGLRKGDSGSWVIDTSSPLRYKIIGSAIASSEGAAHFIRLSDQICDMAEAGKICHLKDVSFPRVFRTLVQCAHLAHNRGDPSSAWFIDQALSPNALEQLRREWYMPAIKQIIHSKAKGVDAITALRGLLLRYGPAILDQLPSGEEWLRDHAHELGSSEHRIAADLVSHAGRLFTAARLLTSTVVSKGEASPPDRSQYAYGLLLTRKPTGLPSIVLLLVLPMVAFGSVAGLVAVVVFLAVETGNNVPALSSTTVSLGLASGAISSTIWSLQVGLIYLLENYDWHLYIGRLGPTGWRTGRLCTVTMTILLLFLALLSAAGRAMLPALYAARLLNIADIDPILNATAAAAVPMLLSTVSPSISWYIVQRLYIVLKLPRRLAAVKIIGSVVLCGLWCLIVTAFDALSGYTFGKVYQDQGYSFIQPSSLAASLGVFGALTTLWPVLSIVAFSPLILPVFMLWLIIRTRYKYKSSREVLNPDPESNRRILSWVMGASQNPHDQTNTPGSYDMTSAIMPLSSTWEGSTALGVSPEPQKSSSDRISVAEALTKIGKPLGAAAYDSFGDSEFQSSGASHFPEIPGKELRNLRLPQIKETYDPGSEAAMMTRSPSPVELSTETPEHKEPDSPRLISREPHLPNKTFFTGLTEYLSTVPSDYQLAARRDGGLGYTG